ncbi:MAG TPA: phage protein GemA/Gp16 family protein [Oleiagrimonas sp.]|nr:phage protein GemA/Gp16 family protein [Oleiagrimonas sp.]
MAIEGPFNGTRDGRRKELARIHCLARDLGLDRSTYESVVCTVTGAASASQLDAVGRRKLIAHLRGKLGITDNRNDPDAPHNLASRPMLRKIGGMLAEAGRPWSYAEALAQRVAKRDRLTFCSDADLRKIIAALTYDKGRRARRAKARHD